MQHNFQNPQKTYNPITVTRRCKKYNSLRVHLLHVVIGKTSLKSVAIMWLIMHGHTSLVYSNNSNHSINLAFKLIKYDYTYYIMSAH